MIASASVYELFVLLLTWSNGQPSLRQREKKLNHSTPLRTLYTVFAVRLKVNVGVRRIADGPGGALEQNKWLKARKRLGTSGKEHRVSP